MAVSPRKSAGSKKAAKEESPSVGEDDGSKHEEEQDEDEEGEGEGEYEIEKIIDARKGHFDPGQWAFQVSWKGYDSSEDSWVKEDDFFAKDMIAKFWEDHPEKKEGGKKPRGSVGRPRKSEASSKPTKTSTRSSTGGRDRKAASAETSEGEEKPASKKTNKRKSAKEESDVEMEDPEPAPKKSKTTSSKKKMELSPSPKNGFFDAESGSEALPEHDEDAMQPHMHKKNWDSIIARIDTVERQGTHDLAVYFTCHDGIKSIAPSSTMNKKAPQTMLDFYEGHLRWRMAGEDPVM